MSQATMIDAAKIHYKCNELDDSVIYKNKIIVLLHTGRRKVGTFTSFLQQLLKIDIKNNIIKDR